MRRIEFANKRWRSAALKAFVALIAASPAASMWAAEQVQVSPATTAAQANLVDVATLAPDVQRDIRYAGSHNFTGAPVDGYQAPKCLLLAPVAHALAQVQADLRQQHLTLKLFDCYRPVRSVQAFVRWAGNMQDQRMKSEFYPSLDKSKLLGDYIASTSGHSRGATADLTLARCVQGRCTELDMGTSFDFFDPRANTANPNITNAQRANRQLLLKAMQRRGFANYPMEWWHFTWQPEPTAHTAYDVPIR